MDRVLRATAATISVTLQVDGTGTDPSPDVATIEVLRADGSTLVAAGTATTNQAAGKFTYTLSPSQTAQLDRLTARWTATVSGFQQTLETTVEIVGGFLFSLALAREDAALSSTSEYPTDRLTRVRTWAEQALEGACGVAFVPRYERETLSGDGDVDLGLKWPRVRTIRSASVDGTALTITELATLKTTPLGAYWPSNWARGTSNVVIDYEHGYDIPPGEVSRACLRLAKHYLVAKLSDDRAIREDTDYGSYLLATPGVRGSRFGLPEVDTVVQSYGYVLGVA